MAIQPMFAPSRIWNTLAAERPPMSDCSCKQDVARLREELIRVRERLAKLEEHSHEPQEIAPRVVLELVRLGYMESEEQAAAIIEDVARRRAAANPLAEDAMGSCCGEAGGPKVQRASEPAQP